MTNSRTLDYTGLLDITVIVIQASIKGASRPHIIILKQEHTCYINMGRQTLLYILNLVSRFPQITSLGMPGHNSNIPYWGDHFFFSFFSFFLGDHSFSLHFKVTYMLNANHNMFHIIHVLYVIISDI